MPLPTTLLRPLLSHPIRLPHLTRLTSSDNQPHYPGRPATDHVNNRHDELNVQTAASRAAKRDRAEGAEENSQATSEKDKGGQNAQAQKDHPEAPGPVIGMNDERGGMGHKG